MILKKYEKRYSQHADKQRKNEARQQAKEWRQKCQDKKKGLGNAIKSMKSGYANPMLYVKVKRKTEEGKEEVAYVTKPEEIDAEVRKAWRRISDGNMRPWRQIMEK